jgi:hypothetical protein
VCAGLLIFERVGGGVRGEDTGPTQGADANMTAARSALLTLALAIVLSAALVLWGAPAWILLVTAAVAWVIALRTHFGLAFAIAATFVGCLWFVLILLVVTALVGAPLLLSVDLFLAVAGIAACEVVRRNGAPSRATNRRNVAALVAAGLGTAIWLFGSVSNAIARPIAGLAWAMHGDAASYLLYARAVTTAGGVVLGPNANPVPIPAAMFALFMAPGRNGVSSGALLRHDLFAYESLQIMTIAMSCLLAGLLTGEIATRVHGGALVAGVCAAVGSVLPLSWLLTTNSLTYGYFDAELALPVVLAGTILALQSRERPVASASALLLTSTVILAVWRSPLVVVLIALVALTVVRERSSVLLARGWRRVILIGCFVQLRLWGLAVTLPSLVAQGHLLSSQGAIYSFTHSLFPSLGVVVILLSLLALRLGRTSVGAIGVVVPLALAAGLAALLYESRSAPGGWSYFPVKFEWLSVAVLVVLMLGFLPAFLLPWITRRSARWIAVISIVSMGAIVVSTSRGSASDHEESNLLSWIGQSADQSDGGARTAAIILAAGNPARPTLYWQSEVPNERYLNYWFLELEARTMQNNALRNFAFSYQETGVGDLCTILMRTPGRTTIYTLETTLAAQLAAGCGSVSPRIVIVKK